MVRSAVIQAYQGDPETGEPLDGLSHEHHIRNVSRVDALVADQSEAITFFCGGSRNFSQFVGLFDEVFVSTSTSTLCVDGSTSDREASGVQNSQSATSSCDCTEARKTSPRAAW